jgi:hypothetical protein
MTERTPDEIAAIQSLVRDFYQSINEAGVDRQTAVDALEYAAWDMLIDCVDSRESLDRYLDVMRERCLGLWELRHPN